MSRLIIGFLVAVTFAGSACGEDVDPKSPADGGVSRSRSRQFIVHGKDGTARGAVCVFCEEVKEDLLSLLKQSDHWRYPIVLQLKGDTTNINTGQPIKLGVFKLPGGMFRLQANVYLGDAFTAELLRGEVSRLLLAEFILRAQPEANLFGRRKVLPDWLRIGISEAIEYRYRNRPTELFSTIFRKGKVMPINEILDANIEEMNSVSEAIYRASCCGFVFALLAQDGGSEKMRKLISSLAVHRGSSKDLLEKIFPGTSESKNSLEKWWALEFATMAQPTVKDILNPVETDRALAQCLRVRFAEESKDIKRKSKNLKTGKFKILSVLKLNKTKKNKEVPNQKKSDTQVQKVEFDLVEYRRFVDRPDLGKRLKQTEIDLMQLSYRAFPLYRPMIQEYQKILLQIVSGKIRDLDKKLAELSNARALLTGSSQDATDYLNWYEATQVKMRSGAFTAYEKAVNELNRPVLPRNDELSRYLDELEKEFR